jgi:carbonic anhydrase
MIPHSQALPGVAKGTFSPDEALDQLIQGNLRFASGLRSVNTLIDIVKLKELAVRGQRPFSIILTCSDSRLPTETVFDCGLGDLYVLRVAGNTLSDVYLAGIEYAVQFFSAPLCVVLGHTGCGAIQATYDQLKDATRSPPSSHIRNLLNSIGAGMKLPKDPTELAWDNIRRNVLRIQNESSLIRDRIQEKRLKIVGGIYDLSKGLVTFDS